MLRRRRGRSAGTTTVDRWALADLHAWILSLPWVVERPNVLGVPGVRCFGVDCEPLERRQLWLITGMQPHLAGEGIDLAVIVPAAVGHDLENTGWARVAAPMPRCHVLAMLHAPSMVNRHDLEGLVLTAYDCATS